MVEWFGGICSLHFILPISELNMFFHMRNNFPILLLVRVALFVITKFVHGKADGLTYDPMHFTFLQ